MSDTAPEATVDGHLLVDQLRFMARNHGDEPGYVDLDSNATLTFR